MYRYVQTCSQSVSKLCRRPFWSLKEGATLGLFAIQHLGFQYLTAKIMWVVVVVVVARLDARGTLGFPRKLEFIHIEEPWDFQEG